MILNRECHDSVMLDANREVDSQNRVCVRPALGTSALGGSCLCVGVAGGVWVGGGEAQTCKRPLPGD